MVLAAAVLAFVVFVAFTVLLASDYRRRRWLSPQAEVILRVTANVENFRQAMVRVGEAAERARLSVAGYVEAHNRASSTP